MNLFRELPDDIGAETFEQIAAAAGARIERIVSYGQITPPDRPYRQPHAEWVLVLEGAARLWLEGAEGEVTLLPGDNLLIPADTPHRVTWTAEDRATIWLAVHFAHGT